MKKTVQLLTCLVFFAACSKNNSSNQPDNGSSSCKDTPAQLAYGKTTFDFVYNGQGNPVKFTSTKAISVKQPTGVIITAYTIAYDGQGRVNKVSRVTDSKPNGYYVPEYNSTGQMIKLGEYDVPGQNNVHSTAVFDTNGRLVTITTTIDGDSDPQICNYTYDGTNLIKKSVQHFYDPLSSQFIDADFTYDYYTDKVKKDKSFFTGLLGLRIMADFADSKSIYYISTAERGQLFFAQEGTMSKNILKHIKVTAQRYHTTDDTDVDYTYEYDADGFFTHQNGKSIDLITRTEPTPFGGPALVIEHNDFSSAFTIGYLCP